MKRLVLHCTLFLIAAGSIFAQTPAPVAAPAKPQAEADWESPNPVYVRRFSVSATISVLAVNLIKTGYSDVSYATPVLQVTSDATSEAMRVGWGGAVQLAMTEKTAVSFGAIRRRTEYRVSQMKYYGVDKSSTAADDRDTTSSNEWTRAGFWDFPILLRYYNKSRHDYGPRWFLEAGGTMRTLDKLRGRLQSINTEGNITVDSAYRAAHKKSFPGVTAGFGVQLIDPVGVRVVPEVRYTRWFGTTFDTWPPRSARNQLEVNFSLGF